VDLHGRSGSVALPLVKLAPASPARLEVTDADARRADRVASVRRSEEDITELAEVDFHVINPQFLGPKGVYIIQAGLFRSYTGFSI